MFRIVAILSLVGLSAADLQASSEYFVGVKSDVVELFDEWMEEHEKFYETLEEKAKRVLIFAENHRK